MSSDVVGKSITTRTIDFIYNYKKDGTIVKHTVTPSSSTSYLTSQSFTIPNVESGDVLVFNVPTLTTLVSYKMFLATWTWKGETFNTKTTTLPDTQFVDKSAYSSTTLTEPNRTTFSNATGVWNLDPYYNSNTLKGAQFKWIAPVLFPKIPDSSIGNTTLNSKIVSDVKGYAVCFRRLYSITHYNSNKVLIKTYDIDTSTTSTANQALIYNFTIPNVAFGDILAFKTNHDIYLTFDGVTTVINGPYDASVKRFLATWTWNGQEFNSKTTLFKNTVYRTKQYNPDIDFTYNPLFANADAVWDAYDVGNTTKSAVFEWKAFPDRVNSNIFGSINGNTVLEEEFSCNKGSIVTEISSTGSSYIPRIKCSDGKVLNKQSEIPTATVNVNQCTNPQKGFRGISSNGTTGTQYGFTCGSAYPSNWIQGSALPPQFSLPAVMDSNKITFTAPDGMALTGMKVYYDKTNGSVKNMQGLYSYNPFDTVPLNQFTLSSNSAPPPLTTTLNSFNSIQNLPLLPDPPLPPLPISSDPSQYYYATENNYKWQYPVATMSVKNKKTKQTLSTDQCPACTTCQTCQPKPVPFGHVSSDNFGVKSTSPYRVCPSGSNVTEIYGSYNAKNQITSYGMKCSNGTDLGSVGVYNQSLDKTVSISVNNCSNSDGFSGAYGYGSTAGLLKLAPKCNNATETTPNTNFGVSAVSGGGVTVNPFNYTCPKGMVLSGFSGNNNSNFPSGSSIDNVQFLCTYNPNNLQKVSSSIVGLPVKPVVQVVIPAVKPLPVVYETLYAKNKNKSFISTFFPRKRETETVVKISSMIKPLPTLPDPPLAPFPVSEDPLKYYYSSPGTYKYTPRGGILPVNMCPECETCNTCGIVPKKVNFNQNIQISFVK